MHHPQYSNEAVEIQLEKCVANGTVKKVRQDFISGHVQFRGIVVTS
jgi:hypothetical protein